MCIRDRGRQCTDVTSERTKVLSRHTDSEWTRILGQFTQTFRACTYRRIIFYGSALSRLRSTGNDARMTGSQLGS